MTFVLLILLVALFFAALLAPAPLPRARWLPPRWKGSPLLPVQRWRGEWRGWVLL